MTSFRESEDPIPLPPVAPACRKKCGLWDQPLGQGLPAPDAQQCGSCYSREIDEGVLLCHDCGSVYPIVHAVPRLVRNAAQEYPEFFQRYPKWLRQSGIGKSGSLTPQRDPRVFDPRSNESFGLQWMNQAEADKTWFKDDSLLRKEEFLDSLAIDAAELSGALILDAGCGNGRLTTAVGRFGAEVVGMDLSAGIDRAQAWKKRHAADHEHFVHFVQGNVMELPFRRGSFDIVHSSGVLHHTPNTERSFHSILSAVRRGGRVYVQLYRRREAWVGIPNRLIRSITSRLPTGGLYWLCRAAVPLHTALVRLVAYARGEPTPITSASVGERALSLFDNFSPRYQYRYTPDQVRDMFQRAGLVDIQDTTLANEARHMVAFTGRLS